jgi:hypothetical protein
LSVSVTGSKAGFGARRFTAQRAVFDSGSKTAIGFADGCFFMRGNFARRADHAGSTAAGQQKARCLATAGF